MKIIYGGSFNPPTVAHKSIYNFLDSKLDFNEFIYLPVSKKYGKEYLESNEDRYNMLSLITKDLPKAKVSSAEFKDDAYLGTYHYLKGQGDDTYFLMGSDNLLTIKSWINYKLLIKECKFIVIERDKEDMESFINNDKELSKYRDNFILFDDFDCDASSSKYRNEKDESIIPTEVLDYIKEHKLYGGMKWRMDL